ncbi:hypothetical protein ACFXP7_05780 [Microbacterium sp. P06]|uniref:hypothetical protein n=1 Tax=unclassified Microbacterium TaxID=2609290 RepID=UPI0037460E05
MHTDEIDQLLTRSDPANDLSAQERRLTAEMIEKSTPMRKRRGYARPLAVGAIAAVLLGGGGMAAAAASGLWEGWAQNDALAIVHYELPSGVSCEWRIGNVRGAPDEVDQVIREALADLDLTDADIAEGAAYVGVTGDPLTDAHAYETGISWAVTLRIERALAAHDLDDKWTSIGGQGFCE